jgi:zinc D-Ala-D-Ala carboxypeptidase
MNLPKSYHLPLTVALVLTLAALLGGGYYAYTTYARLTGTIATQTKTIGELSQKLSSAETDKETLSLHLSREQAKNAEFEAQIESITDTVGDLDKLSKTDPELLQKYSKVYFLNEHYIPPLREIDSKYLLRKDNDEFFHKELMRFLTRLMDAARKDDIDISILSAYRSFESQSDLKGIYRVTYGSGANAFSADQGYSEHQLGSTVDFTTSGLGAGLSGFESTETYTWLLENAHKYGFVLSYPKGNIYYIFEPWHWRFVGEELARALHEDEKSFYDLDQRELDEYLIKFFD